jgi:alpha-D-ribose 1-methylphosphonate 5-triphosphate synthase subunit PhnH
MARVAFIANPLCLPPLGYFYLGEEDRLEKSTTLILQVAGFSEPNGRHRDMSGGACRLQAKLTGLPLRFWSDWGDQRRYLPFGIDVFFTFADKMVALPRGLQTN